MCNIHGSFGYCLTIFDDSWFDTQSTTQKTITFWGPGVMTIKEWEWEKNQEKSRAFDFSNNKNQTTCRSFLLILRLWLGNVSHLPSKIAEKKKTGHFWGFTDSKLQIRWFSANSTLSIGLSSWCHPFLPPIFPIYRWESCWHLVFGCYLQNSITILGSQKLKILWFCWSKMLFFRWGKGKGD